MNPRVFEVGTVTGMDGTTVRVSVDYDAVVIRGHAVPLNHEQAETFAQLFVRACWLAGQQDT